MAMNVTPTCPCLEWYARRTDEPICQRCRDLGQSHRHVRTVRQVNYYNDNDRHSADWLRNLVAAGLIPPGDVDERSIADVRGTDLDGYTQCHFFAGIGGWPYALELAGWPATRPVWTGSCPCQPFSSAGKRGGESDERHLWPEFHRLIAECKPSTVLGEQVSGRLGLAWLSGVRADLEASGYAVGALDLSAAGVGAPHIRQRLYWVADAAGIGYERGGGTRSGRSGLADNGVRLGDSESERLEGASVGPDLERGTLGDADLAGSQGLVERRNGAGERPARSSGVGLEHAESDGREQRRAEPNGGSIEPRRFWDDAEWITFRDGKRRRVEPGSAVMVAGLPFVLADGGTREGASRAETLRGIGNSIVPPLAASFIRAYMDSVAPR